VNIRRALFVLAALAMWCSVRVRAVAAAGEFDGRWAVNLACPKAPDGALAFTFEFSADIKDNVIHGEHGQADKPGWMSLDGTIQAGGDANLQARGLTGGTDYNINHAQSGIPYTHPVTAHFDASQGAGKWVTFRTCNFTFTKM
jgi:hypothetical protein